jgi:hypothetical protein
MDLIIGTLHITPDAIMRTATGIEAILYSDALLFLLNATFHGFDKIEILGGDFDRRQVEVTWIEMGDKTRLMLAATWPGHRLI